MPLTSCIRKILEGLNGTINIADDVLVYGCDYNSFNSNVTGFLGRCVEKDLHLNPDKIQINVPNVPFFGLILTKDGLKPDPHRATHTPMVNFIVQNSCKIGNLFLL